MVIALLIASLPLAIIPGVMYGAASLPAQDVLLALTGLGEANAQSTLIVQQLRLPRVLLAALVGAILAICGAAMQGLFRNPLADPSLIGVTAGASVGASVAIVFGTASAGVFSSALSGLGSISLIALGAFAGAIIATLLVYKLATDSSGAGRASTGTSVATMLLAGIAITALAGSVTGLLDFYASNEMLRRISLWRMGGLEGANWTRVSIAAVTATAVLVVLPLQAKALNALLLGESEARHLGIRVDHCKRLLITTVAAGVGVSVALAGTIAFVGLVVPHIVRLLIGPDHRYLLPASALAGATLLISADTVARIVVAPTELPVGLLTALLGAPFFISLLRSHQRYGLR